eukprot:GHVQ01030921.1.p1 GENE.GHVQ01030921.1~~GHVQ01030921.1.p1  ORF type:complete len:187 (-),score=20.39 GHVQ01030921.1:113-673(-)
MAKSPVAALKPTMKTFQIIGRAAPTEKVPSPKIYRMRLFAKNVVLAKSKFWYFMKKINKVKKSRGEILGTNELHEPKAARAVHNYGVWLRYDSRTGTHNMYKEFRDISQNGVVEQVHAEMAGNHRALSSCIQIIRIAPLKDSECKRPHILQMHKKKLRFPVVRRLPLVPKRYRTTFKATRPTTFVK